MPEATGKQNEFAAMPGPELHSVEAGAMDTGKSGRNFHELHSHDPSEG
jgi:hypothetical protein